MMNVIIAEGLVDKEYVANYTVGYDELAERAKEYPPEKVAAITGISAETSASWRANTRPPARRVIRIGVAVERHAGGGQTVRALTCLPALVGAWRDVGGGILQLPDLGLPGEVGEPDAAGLDQARHARAEPVEAGRGAHRRATLDPPIQSLFVYNANPAMWSRSRKRSSKGWRAKTCSRW